MRVSHWTRTCSVFRHEAHRLHRVTSVLKRGAHRLVLKLKWDATQACVLEDVKLLWLAFEWECEATQVRVLMINATAAFSVERDLRVSCLMKFAFELKHHSYVYLKNRVWVEVRSLHLNAARLWLCPWWFLDSLLNPLQSFWNPLVDWEGFENILDFILIWAFVIGRTIFWGIRNLILNGFWSSWVYHWTTWNP